MTRRNMGATALQSAKIMVWLPRRSARTVRSAPFSNTNYGDDPNMNWLENFALLSPTVEVFIQQKRDRHPDNYQVKWDALRTILNRRPSGTLKYLPDKSVVQFSIIIL